MGPREGANPRATCTTGHVVRKGLFTMTTQESSRKPPAGWVALNYLLTILGVLVFAAGLIIAWPMVQARLAGETIAPVGAPQAQPTAQVFRGQPYSGGASDARPAATPIPGIAQNEATATAQYNQAIQESQRGAIVLPQNDTAPVLRVQEQTDRQPAGDNVPVAEPVDESAAPVNIQQTHECRHGQVWTDAGCKNPDSKGSKSTP